MNLSEIKALDKNYFMNTFGERLPVCFESGKGIYLSDTEGNTYCDFFAGIAVSALGHGNEELASAIGEQAKRVLHTSCLYYIESQAKLAKEIVSMCCGDKVFFSNSGAEANECVFLGNGNKQISGITKLFRHPTHQNANNLTFYNCIFSNI